MEEERPDSTFLTRGGPKPIAAGCFGMVFRGLTKYPSLSVCSYKYAHKLINHHKPLEEQPF